MDQIERLVRSAHEIQIGPQPLLRVLFKELTQNAIDGFEIGGMAQTIEQAVAESKISRQVGGIALKAP